MKANRKNKLSDDSAEVSTQMIGGIVGLLLVIVIGVMVYFSFTDSIDSMNEMTETFTGYADTTNGTAWSVELDNSPDGKSNCNVTCVNISAGAESYPAYGLNSMTVSVAANAAKNFTQVNVTYTSKMASDGSDTTDMAGTVFTLAPIIALVIVASIILGAVIGFGGKKGGI